MQVIIIEGVTKYVENGFKISMAMSEAESCRYLKVFSRVYEM